MPPAASSELLAVSRIGHALAAYVFAGTLSLLVGLTALHVWSADLHAPFVYHGDTLYYAMLIKTIVDQGGWMTNAHLGVPGVLQLYDFPQADTVHLLAIKGMALFTSDWPLLLNLYFLLGFPLITVSALAVLRHFRVRYGPALVASLLYAFLPSRLIKNEAHLFLDVFYEVPLAILVALWVCSGHPPMLRASATSPGKRLALRSPRTLVAIGICLLTALTGIYYAFFAGVLMVLGGLWASLERRTWRNALAGLMLSGVILAGLAVQDVPTFVYHRRHGPNGQVAARSVAESEAFGMEITQLLLPTTEHRVSWLRRLKQRYDLATPRTSEGSSITLGIVGSVGFLALVIVLLVPGRWREKQHELLRPLAVLNLFAVLVSTVGGFGTLFALVITPQIRSYARMNVFIAFLSLCAVAILIDALCARFPRLAVGSPATVGGVGLIGLIAAMGLFDQVTPAAVRDYAAARVEYQNDRAFIRDVEAAAPPGAMIFQLPHQVFPEALAIPGQPDLGYDLLHPYLHGSTLRWSYPTMAGRADDAWLTEVARRSPAELVRTVSEAGFEGILIDRRGYGDNAVALEKALRGDLAVEPAVAGDGRLAFFNLGARNRQAAIGLSPEERARRRDMALHPLFLAFGEGCHGLEVGPNGPFRWFAGTGSVTIENNSRVDHLASLSMTVFAASPPSSVVLDGDLLRESIPLPPQGTSFSRTLNVAPGRHVVRFLSRGRPADAPFDPREMVWRIENPIVGDLPRP